MVQGCSSAPLCSRAHHLRQQVTHISAQQLPSSSISLFYRTQGTARSCSTMLGTWEAPGLDAGTSAEAWWCTPINRDPSNLTITFFHWKAVSFVNTKVLLWQVITYWINFLPSISRVARRKKSDPLKTAWKRKTQNIHFFQMATVGCMSFTFRKALKTLQDKRGSIDITQEEFLALTGCQLGFTTDCHTNSAAVGFENSPSNRI